MKNRTKLILLSIAVLCISVSSALAGNAPSGNKVHGDVPQKANGTFKATIYEPLYIGEVKPDPAIGDNDLGDYPIYVKGATYSFNGIERAYCQYTIHGRKSTIYYISSNSSFITREGTFPYDYNSIKSVDKNGKTGVSIYMLWTIANGSTDYYDGKGNIPHKLKSDGSAVLTIDYRKVVVDANAENGLYVFEQTIQVSYNPF